MRQSDGSEILGPNDPRNLVIGIIHVSPSDDRQSVITAITTQEKLGRDQIVLELPAQNKAFKTAVDFEGLRKMASEIEAAIVLVIPQKSKFVDFARKESFPTYNSLDELVAAEFPPMQPDEAEAAVNSAPAVKDGEEDRTISFPVTPPPASPFASVPPTPPPAPASPPVNAEKEAAVAGKQLSEPPEPPTSPLPQDANAPQLAEEDELPTDQSQAAGVGQTAPAQQVVPPGSYLPVPLPINGNALVPSNAQPPVYYEPIDQYRRRFSWRGLAITSVIVVLLIGMGILFYRPILDLIFPPTATVTIIPDSQLLKHTYQITAVLGAPNPTKDQVDARALYANSQMQSQTVQATGQGQTPGQQAQGILTFYNISTSAQVISAGTVFIDDHNVAVANDDTLTLPPFDPTQATNAITDNAHTINVGSNQNIPANDFDHVICCNSSVYMTNTTAFTGGQDPQTFTYVQQSDINSVTQSLETSLAQQATMTLQSQVRPNEKPVGPPRCTPQVTSDHQAGEQASSVTVSVTASCLGEVYDMQAVQVLAAGKLNQDASKNPGPAYLSVGEVLTTVAQATPGSRGDVLLVVNAQGVWVYQFTKAQRAHLASLIAGKSSQDARALLLRQPGVHDAAISLTGAGATTLPADTSRVTVNVEAVQGLHP